MGGPDTEHGGARALPHEGDLVLHHRNSPPLGRSRRQNGGNAAAESLVEWELAVGSRTIGIPKKRYKDQMKDTLKNVPSVTSRRKL